MQLVPFQVPRADPVVHRLCNGSWVNLQVPLVGVLGFPGGPHVPPNVSQSVELTLQLGADQLPPVILHTV